MTLEQPTQQGGAAKGAKPPAKTKPTWHDKASKGTKPLGDYFKTSGNGAEKGKDTPKSVLGTKRDLVDSVVQSLTVEAPTEEGSGCPVGAGDAKQQRVSSGEENISSHHLEPLHGDKGPLAMVTMQQFESMLRTTQGAALHTIHTKKNKKKENEDAPHFLEYGKDFDVDLDEVTNTAYAIFCNVSENGHTSFLKEKGSEYPSLVIDDCITVTDVITWFVDNRNVNLTELRKEFKMQKYGSFMGLLKRHNHVEMMPDAESGLYRPIVVIEDLAVKISLFELLLHIRDPGVSKTYILQDRYTAASSHVPALFCDTATGCVHLYWSTPWPLGLAELPGDAEVRHPFSAKHILVFANSVFFSLFTGDVVHFNKQGRVTRFCRREKKEITIKAGDLVHACLNGVSITSIQALSREKGLEIDHCPIFHMQHSAHATRLATKAQNCRNQFQGRSLFGCTRYLNDEEIEKILGKMSNPDDDPDSWYEGWVAHHSHDMGELQNMARDGKTLKVPLKRVNNTWFHTETSMMCREISGAFVFAMPEGCSMETHVEYPRINANLQGVENVSVPVRIHLILYDSFRRYKTNGEYTARPVIQKIGDECHVMVVDHMAMHSKVDVYEAALQASDMNQIRKMAARAEHLELVTCRENVMRSMGYNASLQIEGPDGTVYESQSVSKATLFAFLGETLRDIRVTDDSLKYWWEHRFAKGKVADVILEKNLTVTLNGFRIIERGLVSKQAEEARKCKTDVRGLDRLWVFVYFGSEFPKVVRFVSGIPDCRALLQKYAPAEKGPEPQTLFRQPIRIGNKYVKKHKCLFRPVNKTKDAEGTWEGLHHIPLSVILKNDEESMNQIVQHYEEIDDSQRN